MSIKVIKKEKKNSIIWFASMKIITTTNFIEILKIIKILRILEKKIEVKQLRIDLMT